MPGAKKDQNSSTKEGHSVRDRLLSLNSDCAMQFWTGASIANEIQTKNVGEIYHRWQCMNKSKLPRLCDFLSIEPPLFDDLLITTRFNRDDFVVVYQSSNRIRRLGYDLRGKLLSEVGRRHGNAILEINNKCLASNTAVYARFLVDGEKIAYREAICFPFAADDSGRPFFVLNGISEVSEMTEFLQYLYDQSPDGMIIAIRLFGKQSNDISGARVLSLNARAKKVLTRNGREPNFYSVADLGPWLRDVLRWTRTSIGKYGETTKYSYKDEVGSEYELKIESLSHFILVSIRPPPGMRFAGDYEI